MHRAVVLRQDQQTLTEALLGQVEILLDTCLQHALQTVVGLLVVLVQGQRLAKIVVGVVLRRGQQVPLAQARFSQREQPGDALLQLPVVATCATHG